MNSNDTNWISKRDKENVQPDSTGFNEIFLEVRQAKPPHKVAFQPYEQTRAEFSFPK